MDTGMVHRVLDCMESIVAETGMGKVHVTLHGGEPLAAGHDVIEALLSGLHERFRTMGLDVGMQSNLWLLDERFCKLFKKCDVSVSTSLDGPQDINDAQRGEGCFKKTMAGIRLARSQGLNPRCITTFTSLSAPRWKDVFGFFMSQNISFSVHASVAALGRSTGLELTPDQYQKLFSEMFECYVENRRNIKIESYDQIVQGVACNEGRVCTFRDCFGMFLAIDPYGDIYSCQRFAGKPEYRLGNIADHPTMTDLVNSPMAQRLLARETVMQEKCDNCEHYSYCKGGCAYNAIAGSDRFDSVDPNCEAYKSEFSIIKSRLHEEMVSDDNFQAISEFGPSERGNPLLRVGPVIDLADEHAHPYFVANTARKIVAAYELAKAPDANAAAIRLMQIGVYRSKESAEAALCSLQNNMQPRGRLNKLYIHITWNCQLKCSHCYASAQSDASVVEMDADQIIKMVRDARGCGFQEVVLTGGEPLLHKDRNNLLKKLSSVRWEIKPAKLVLRTNLAMPLSLEDHLQLASAFDEVVVSVDGGKEEHDKRRGEGSYDNTVKNLELYTSSIAETILSGTARIRSARLSIAATIKADQVNDSTGFSVKDLGHRLNIRRVKFRPLLPLGRALDLDEPVVSEALRSYLEPIELIKEGFMPVHSCGIGQNLYVEPSGESFPCYSYHELHSFLGNAVQNGLETIISSEPFIDLQKHTVDTNKKCRRCEYRYLCGGACRAWGREATKNDLDATPVECDGLWRRAERLYSAACEYLSQK